MPGRHIGLVTASSLSNHRRMVDQFTKKELSVRLRNVLDELEKVCDEIIITYLDDRDEQDEEPPVN